MTQLFAKSKKQRVFLVCIVPSIFHVTFSAFLGPPFFTSHFSQGHIIVTFIKQEFELHERTSGPTINPVGL